MRNQLMSHPSKVGLWAGPVWPFLWSDMDLGRETYPSNRPGKWNAMELHLLLINSLAGSSLRGPHLTVAQHGTSTKPITDPALITWHREGLSLLSDPEHRMHYSWCASDTRSGMMLPLLWRWRDLAMDQSWSNQAVQSLLSCCLGVTSRRTLLSSHSLEVLDFSICRRDRACLTCSAGSEVCEQQNWDLSCLLSSQSRWGPSWQP